MLDFECTDRSWVVSVNVGDFQRAFVVDMQTGEGALRVLVVGGGIAGLTCAAALSRRGARVVLVERRHDWAPVGAGILLVANSMRALSELDLAETVAQRGLAVERLRYCGPAGESLRILDLREAHPDSAPFVAIHRAELQRALREGCTGVEVRLGTTVEALDVEGTQARAALSDGSELEVDLVIGADGIRSHTRELLFGSSAPELSPFVGFRAAQVQEPTYFLGDAQVGVLCPLGRDRAYLYLGMGGEAAQADPSGGSLERFRKLFAGFGGPMGEAIAGLREHGELAFGVDRVVEVEAWHRGRAVLVGDAAHAGLPSMAQGASRAIEDALVLAAQLGRCLSVEYALAALERRRRPRVEWVQARSREYTAGNLRRGITTAQRAAHLGSAPVHELAERWRALIDELP